MSKRDIKLFLTDITDAIEKVQRYVSGKSFEDFQEDDLLIDAVTRNLEVIGEAAKQIPESYRVHHLK